jgi:hypothetical protein
MAQRSIMAIAAGLFIAIVLACLVIPYQHMVVSIGCAAIANRSHMLLIL